MKMQIFTNVAPISQKNYAPPTVEIQTFRTSDIIVTSPEVGGEWPWQEDLVNFG